MKDEIIREVWKAKDEIAQECGHDLHKLAALLRKKQKQRGHKTVNLANQHAAGSRAKP
jgi:hypothetical protein